MIAPLRLPLGAARAVACFALAAPVAAMARVPDWVKPHLAADVAQFASGHPAVMLFESADVRYLTPDRVRRVYRGILRVRDERGRAHARCVYPFNPDLEKIVVANAWVISPDGRRSEDFRTSHFTQSPLHIGRHFWTQQRILGLVAEKVVVGGVFAWEFQVESQTGISDVNWTFRSELPVRLSSIEVAPFDGGRLEWHGTDSRIPTPIGGGALGALRWERKEFVPPGGDRPERFLPEPQWLSVRAVAAEEAAPRNWSGLAQVAASVIEPQIIISPDARARAAALTAGKTGRWERIRALTEFVQKDIAYLAVSLGRDYLAGYRPHPPADVLANRYGDCKDKAALLVALLRALGEEAHVVLVHAGNPKAVHANWPAAVFNHAIVGIAAGPDAPAHWPIVDAGADGRLALFDPTDVFTPLGVLSGAVQAGLGLVASTKAGELVSLPSPAPETNAYAIEIAAEVDETGALTARAVEKASGLAGVNRHAGRFSVSQEQFKRALVARLGETIPFLQNVTWSDAWQPATADWTMEFEFKADRYARRTGGSLMLLNPQILGSMPRLTPWRTTEEGVSWMSAAKLEKRVRLALPADVQIEELPDDVALRCATAEARVTYRREASTIVVSSELIQRAAFLGRRDYEELRGLALKAHEAERRPIVLRRGAAGSE